MAKSKKKVAVKAADWSGEGDKTHAVSAAVANQLHFEGRWPPNDMTKVMGTDYRYDEFTLGNFLKAVQWHLANGTPAYTFKFDGAFILKGLNATVGALMVAIISNTT